MLDRYFADVNYYRQVLNRSCQNVGETFVNYESMIQLSQPPPKKAVAVAGSGLAARAAAAEARRRPGAARPARPARNLMAACKHWGRHFHGSKCISHI